MIAAIDQRVHYSFPVAGTYPIFIRSSAVTDQWGDYEQILPSLYRISNYLELYILGGHGKNRKQLQILNQNDSCCFSGTEWKKYSSTIKSKVAEIGDGDWDLYMDKTPSHHSISDAAMDQILLTLESSAN